MKEKLKLEISGVIEALTVKGEMAERVAIRSTFGQNIPSKFRFDLLFKREHSHKQRKVLFLRL